MTTTNPIANGTGAKRGRKTKPYRCPWNGKTIEGLYRKPDGRWRIIETGKEFREADERTAVARFLAWQRTQLKGVLEISVSVDEVKAEAVSDAMDLGAVLRGYEDGSKEIALGVPEGMVWPWLRQQLLRDPLRVAEAVGIPQLASLADLPLPRGSVRLDALSKAYQGYAKAKKVSKSKVAAAWAEFVEITGATTLRELTTEKFLAYGDKLKGSGHSANYIGDKFDRIRRVIRFGLQRGMDATEIRAALDRAAVLVAPENTQPTYKAKPILPADFSKLLKVATPLERAALLLSLNACLYVSEAVAVHWDELDFGAKTFVSHRNKTGIIRAAVLWDRTIEALKALPMTPGAVFKSSRGAAYLPSSLRDLFGALRERAGVAADVVFNQIRDGAYTAACANKVEFHLVQILAGHRVGGQSDNYIARNPSMVAPACQAVERHYFG